ncbi:MAG TPA: glycerol-3-phosphate 1-O-acyltransferase PlsB, partial [Woeseiaceae bacterium]|nr:glycerol-3-phosphate 1-O-acyltransferase PlsB [Woeseiaceae bacterium]
MIAPRFLRQPWIWLLARITRLWIRPAVLPEEPAELMAPPGTRVCYILEYGGLADRLALEQACIRHDLPLAGEGVVFAGQEESTALIVLRTRRGLLLGRRRKQISARLERLVAAAGRDGDEELLLIPVAVYWGRAPEKERSWFKVLFSEQWDIGGRTRKFLSTVLYGRATLVHFSEPLSVRRVAAEGLSARLASRKISRILRVHFRQRRVATLGPDLSHRRTLVNGVVRSASVRGVISQESRGDARKRERLQRKAREYAREIAADMSYPMVRFLDKVLTWAWHQLYDGIRLNGIERVQSVAEGRELVYVPCHRSHMDYILLSYVLYHQGLSLPHVAAGVNLNLPVVGSILRRGGGFFLRRSFRGNRLYAAVFYAYLRALITRGFSIEYFVEGGRSRTGRLLRPKGGMLVMTVESFLQDPRRPVVFVPVYFGYEKLVEGKAYISELAGEEKKKETVFGLIGSLRTLRDYFGEVYVNVGEPLELTALLDRHRPGWRDEELLEGERPAWLPEVIGDLERRIMWRINAAAAVTPISLLALALLATPRQTMPESTLQRQLTLLLELLRRFPYSDAVTVTELGPEAVIAHGEKMGVIRREEHPLGDLILMRESEAVLMTYFLNNVLHLLSIPGLVAACFIQSRRLALAEVVRLVGLTYPYVRAELFLRWRGGEMEALVRDVIDQLTGLGLLRLSEDGQTLRRPRAGSAAAFQLVQLGRLMLPMLQRYYMTIALLERYGSGRLSQGRLERICELSAQRLSMVSGLRSPDFFDRKLFQEFIR